MFTDSLMRWTQDFRLNIIETLYGCRLVHAKKQIVPSVASTTWSIWKFFEALQEAANEKQKKGSRTIAAYYFKWQDLNPFWQIGVTTQDKFCLACWYGVSPQNHSSRDCDIGSYLIVKFLTGNKGLSRCLSSFYAVRCRRDDTKTMRISFTQNKNQQRLLRKFSLHGYK